MITKDEILNIPAGRKVNFLVLHEVVGWTPIYVEGGALFGIPGELDYWIDTNGISRPLGISPSNDIACAWDVLEFLSEKYECSTAVGREYPYRREIYVARMVGGLYEYDNPELKLCAFANTAPLAICRLALLTKAQK